MNKVHEWQNALDAMIAKQPANDYLYRHNDREKASSGQEFFHRKQPTHQQTSESGRKMIPKALFNKLLNPCIKAGAYVVTGEEAAQHLGKNFASHIGGIFFFKDDATISDVLEEVYHFWQERRGDYSDEPINRRECLIEIDAKKYLLSVAERYKIPLEEQDLTKSELAEYERRLEALGGR